VGGSISPVSLFAHKTTTEKKDGTMLKRTDATPIPEPPETTPVLSLKQAPVQLNEGWRVSEDSLQWMLQRRCSKPGQKAKWTGRSFCRTREALLRCVNDHCGIVDAEALKRLEALPDFHA